MSRKDEARTPKTQTTPKTSPEQKQSIALQGYDVLERVVNRESQMTIARCQMYLAVNAALVALTGYLWSSAPWMIYGLALVGVVANLVWFTSNERARAYVTYWYEHLKRLEMRLSPLAVFQSLDLFKAPWWAKTPIQKGYSILAVILAFGWLAMFVALILVPSFRGGPPTPLG